MYFVSYIAVACERDQLIRPWSKSEGFTVFCGQSKRVLNPLHT